MLCPLGGSQRQSESWPFPTHAASLCCCCCSILASSGYRPSNYGFIIATFPPIACPWAGYAYVGGTRSAFQGRYGRDSPVLVHELGHSLGGQAGAAGRAGELGH